MPDLAAGAGLLAVQVDPGARFGGEEVVQPLVEEIPPGSPPSTFAITTTGAASEVSPIG